MIWFILGALATFFTVHMYNVKIAKEGQKVKLGTGIIVSCLSWYGFALVVFVIHLKWLNEFFEDSDLEKSFKGENK